MNGHPQTDHSSCQRLHRCIVRQIHLSQCLPKVLATVNHQYHVTQALLIHEFECSRFLVHKATNMTQTAEDTQLHVPRNAAVAENADHTALSGIALQQVDDGYSRRGIMFLIYSPDSTNVYGVWWLRVVLRVTYIQKQRAMSTDSLKVGFLQHILTAGYTTFSYTHILV